MTTKGKPLYVLAAVLAVSAVLALEGSVGAISGGSINPTVLHSSGQGFQVSYTDRDTTVNTILVEECIANDTLVGFDVTYHCSPLSRQTFFGQPASGTLSYGGNPQANPYAPFVGVDPNSEEWSVCTPDSGVTNYQSGYFRVADSPSDEADDVFIPFTCGDPPATTTTTEPPVTTTTTEPPVTTTTTVPPTTTTTTTVPPTTTTTTVPPTTTTTTVPPTTTTTTVPPTTTTTVPPTTTTTVPPTTTTTVPSPPGNAACGSLATAQARFNAQVDTLGNILRAVLSGPAEDRAIARIEALRTRVNTQLTALQARLGCSR